jgi:hypothetical protein
MEGMAAGGGKLPTDIKQIAAKMGVDITGMEAEAEDMWEMLNKMSSDSPAQYDQFIKQQFEEASKEGGDSTKEDDDDNRVQQFRPNAGICLQAQTIGGNDGIKIRDANAQSGKVMYVNLVHHKALELPKDKNGQPVSEERMTADGLEIPLAVSPVRDIPGTNSSSSSNSDMAVDVVFHPSVIARCQSHNMFLSQIADLALASVTDERGVKFARGWRRLEQQSYKGGRGADKLTPVLFPINQDQTGSGSGSGSSSNSNHTSQDALNSPAALLGQLMKEKTAVEGDVTILGGGRGKGEGNGSSVDISPSSSSSSSSKPVQKPSMKKGFLANNKSGALYPEGGSENGKGSDKGGAFARLMSRSQVIDTKTQDVQQPSQPPLQHQQQQAAPKEQEQLVKPDIQSVLKMDALLDALEGEGSSSSSSSSSSSYDNNGAAPAAESGGGDAVVVSGSLPATHKVTVTKVSLAAAAAAAAVGAGGAGGTPPSPSQQQLVIKVEGLHEVSSLADGSVCDLQVSDRAVTFTLLKGPQSQGPKHLKVSGAPAGSFRLDADSTAASFSKKKKVLTVKVTLV